MSATLETLELTPEELESCREAVRKMAYCKWLDAGRPDSGELDFWVEAEREWIERNYVPHRTLDGTRPEPTHRAKQAAAPGQLLTAGSLTAALALTAAATASQGGLK